ncbi:FkbM family methyltransferase [Halosegnis longus]|uniref:FkbM family methyltransferase n=1 Tax=Halosegnis longus TaxID=2216012 RepID=UPI00129D9FDB|nr:FkbM family methyltransferase [Halosegnis longus]
MAQLPIQFAREVLPRPVKKKLSPVYNQCRRRYFQSRVLTGYNNVRYSYSGVSYEMSYTTDSADKFRNIIKNKEIKAEQVNLKYIASDNNIDAFVDVGAHFGTYSVIGSQLNPGARVFAFEPDEYNRSVLSHVLSINDIQVDIRPEVVTDHTGKTIFYTDDSKGSESHSTNPSNKGKRTRKNTISLSDFCATKDIQSLFVKIDAEGSEAKILKDISSANFSHIEGIVELHPDKLKPDTGDVVSIIQKRFEQCEFLGDSCENHPREESIEYKYNRPIYYFKN